MGRTVQERYGLEPQVAMTMPLLVGTDGVKKMSQSLGNYIGVDDPPDEMFGKTMSIPDTAMVEWFRLAADLDPSEVEEIEAGLASGAPTRVRPSDGSHVPSRLCTGVTRGRERRIGVRSFSKRVECQTRSSRLHFRQTIRWRSLD